MARVTTGEKRSRSSAARRPGRPVGANGDRTRERVLRAAVEIFAREGLAGTSVRDVAHKARIRVSTLYHYFPSKAELYREVQNRVQHEVRELVISALGEGQNLRDGVGAAIGALFDFFHEHRAYLELGYRAVTEPPVRSAVEERFSERWLGLVEGVLKPAEARGEVRGVDLRLFMITVDALVHWHLLNAALYQRLVGGRLDDPAAVARSREHVTQVALRVLGLE